MPIISNQTDSFKENVRQFPQLFVKRSFSALLQQASRDFWTLGLPFVAAISKPVLLIHIGIYGAIIAALSLGYTINTDLAAVSLIASFLGLGIMAIGFWAFMVYVASLNLDYAYRLENRNAKINFRQNYQTILGHTGDLLWYINGLAVIQLIGLLIGIVFAFALLFVMPESWLSVVIQLIMIIIYASFAFGFQIIAFHPNHPGGPLGLLKQSFVIARQGFWQTTLLLILSIGVTYYLIPGIIVSIAEGTGLIEMINRLHQPLIQNYLNIYLNTVSLPATLNSETLSHQLSQNLLTSLVSSWLLPWGTFAFASLYGKLVAQSITEESS